VNQSARKKEKKGRREQRVFVRQYFSGFVLALSAIVCGCGNGDRFARSDLTATFAPGSNSGAVFDLEGKPVDPFGEASAKAVVLAFVSTDCPISNRYAPELERLHGRFSPRGAVFWLVYPNPGESNKDIRTHRTEYRYSFGALRDPGHFLVRKAAARVTPEVAVFAGDGGLAYHGRIDNRYADLNKARPEATTHELANALEAILSGQPVAVTNAPATGCYIQALK
jgi:hypothetical protein